MSSTDSGIWLRMRDVVLPKRVLFASPWWHQDIVNGTVHHAAEHGWHLDLQTVLSGRLPAQWDGAGVITLLGGDLAAQRQFLSKVRCPVVSMNENFPELGLPGVCQDDLVAGQMAAAHFQERAFRLYAFYSHGKSHYASERRREAFEADVRAHGGDVRALLWEEERGERPDTWLERQIWLRRRLNTMAKPLAVFAVNDEAAVEVIEACMVEGIRVPDQVAVLGMLDMHIFRESTAISLSSIKVDFDTMTREACNMLARMMEGEPAPKDWIIYPPTGIAVRQSTNTIAAQTPAVARVVRYLLDHFAEPIDTDAMAKLSRMSKTLLYAAFKQDLGKTPYAVLTEIRIERAKLMLLESNASVQATAEACGFGDPVNLFRNFKRYVGMSPAAFRKGRRE